MASAGPAPSGKRSFDIEINLVPFIDLMSCCICFLLVSAVWTQVAKIDVKPTPNAPDQTNQPPPPDQVKLTVHVRGVGYYLSDGTSSLDLNKIGTDYPVKALDEKLKMLREGYADMTDITVMADDVIPYKEVIVVMDLCLKYGFNGISVASSGV